MTFDPRESAERQAIRRRWRLQRVVMEDPRAYFLGRWEDRNLLNAPGPFYGAETDTCVDGPPLAPDSLLVDELGQGFVWRQPRSDTETMNLMNGCESDPFSGFGWDGDQHWTPELVREWWAEMSRPSEKVQQVRQAYAEVGADKVDRLLNRITDSWTRHLTDDQAVRDARRYIFFLLEGRYPGSDDSLPPLTT